jgi:hypothetical protein
MYKPPKPSPVPADYEAFFKSLNEEEKKLLSIAQERLGSSFFVQWCRLYLVWKSQQAKN